MFATLSDKFSQAFRNLSGRGKISESNVRDALAQVRTALLEADVHYNVVESFTKSVLEKSLGAEVLASLKPGQQMVKIVHDELVALMGPVDSHLMFVDPAPTVVMMCGLQGSGKTTTCGKLAAYLKSCDKSVTLAAVDLQRPAAVQQLETLAKQVSDTCPGSGVVHFYAEPDKVAQYGKAVGAAVDVARNALAAAKKNRSDVLILDTAGRLHINDQLMDELRRVNQAAGPHQIYLVIDAMTGQDAVNSAKAFNEQLELDGVILTKFDSDTRGGAALSARQVTGKPIKFIGVGEKLDALEEFHPDRIASRILGMGDMLSLIEKAQQEVSEEQAMAMQEKMAKGTLTMDDMLAQLHSIKKMGPMKSILGMLPGIGQHLKNMNLDDSQITRTQAIIQSMTPRERKDVNLLDNSRRRRIARGSGTSSQEVSQVIRSFEMMSQMSKQMAGLGMMGKLKALGGLGQMDPASLMNLGRGGAPGFPGLGPGGSTDKSPRNTFKQRKRRSR